MPNISSNIDNECSCFVAMLRANSSIPLSIVPEIVQLCQQLIDHVVHSLKSRVQPDLLVR